ncbi:MAG: hypothetical protein K2M91_00675 [Lachnospiraceae bacterium]|nr:hypothetical protein [Lachnospiraceae bacterium]
MNTLIKSIAESKRIILWGTGNTAKTFCDKYGDKLPIYACTSNDRNIVSVNNLKTIGLQELDPVTDFIIVCSIYYDEIRYQLMCIDGYEPNINFMKYSIFEELYDAEVNSKKLIVAVGQCEIGEMCQALHMISYFKKQYTVIYFDEQKVCAHGNKCDLAETKECLKLLGKADYFIKPSALKPQSMQSFQALQQYVNNQCKTITISLFTMDSYWPQDIAKERTINKYYVVKNKSKLCAFVERDQVIERYIDEGYSTKEIMNLICKDDFFDYSVVKNNHDNCIKRIRIADKISDIKITDFVLHNYNSMKLYCDRGHFNEHLLKEYVRRFLQFLGDDMSEKELMAMDISCITQHVNELPIYPSTAKILKLEFVNKDTLYRENRYDGIRLVTFEEYMEAFITYCQKGRSVLQSSYWLS